MTTHSTGYPCTESQSRPYVFPMHQWQEKVPPSDADKTIASESGWRPDADIQVFGDDLDDSIIVIKSHSSAPDCDSPNCERLNSEGQNLVGLNNNGSGRTSRLETANSELDPEKQSASLESACQRHTPDKHLSSSCNVAKRSHHSRLGTTCLAILGPLVVSFAAGTIVLGLSSETLVRPSVQTSLAATHVDQASDNQLLRANSRSNHSTDRASAESLSIHEPTEITGRLLESSWTVATQDDATQDETEEERRRRFRGRLPNYFSRFIDEDQREQVYSIQADFNEQIAALQEEIDRLTMQRNTEVDEVLTPEQLAEVTKLREEAKARRSTRGDQDGADGDDDSVSYRTAHEPSRFID